MSEHYVPKILTFRHSEVISLSPGSMILAVRGVGRVAKVEHGGVPVENGICPFPIIGSGLCHITVPPRGGSREIVISLIDVKRERRGEVRP